MTTYTFLPNNISKEDAEYYTRMNKGFKATQDCLRVEREDGSAETYVIMKGRYTAYGMVRDCGDHYIRAKYSSYERIDKETLEVTQDVEDR